MQVKRRLLEFQRETKIVRIGLVLNFKYPSRLNNLKNIVVLLFFHNHEFVSAKVARFPHGPCIHLLCNTFCDSNSMHVRSYYSGACIINVRAKITYLFEPISQKMRICFY